MIETLKIDEADPAGLEMVTRYIPPYTTGEVTDSTNSIAVPTGVSRLEFVIVYTPLVCDTTVPLLFNQTISVTSKLNPVMLTLRVSDIPTSTSISIASGMSVGGTTITIIYCSILYL
jgi:hypothetical protein